MECLRAKTVAGRRGTIPCPTEGCLHRRFSIDSNSFVAEEAPKTDCLLQLRLRAGDSQNPLFARGYVWVGDEYREVTVDLTPAQYELVRDHGARFSFIDDTDGSISLIDFKE